MSSTHTTQAITDQIFKPGYGICWLVAMDLLGRWNYNGQADKFYALHCQAAEYLRREYQIRDAEEWMVAEYIGYGYKFRAMKIYIRLRNKHFNT